MTTKNNYSLFEINVCQSVARAVELDAACIVKELDTIVGLKDWGGAEDAPPLVFVWLVEGEVDFVN